jgi:hypothetical protein
MPRLSYDLWASEREKAELLPNGLRVLRDEKGGRPVAKAWKPKAKNPMFNYVFRSMEEREAYIAGVVKDYENAQARKAEYRAERATGDLTLANPGVIFCYSWGYEQTNVEYYQVIARHGQLVTLREIGCESVPGSAGPMSDSVRPLKDAFVVAPCAECGGTQRALWHSDCGAFEHAYTAGPPQTITKRVQFSAGEPFLRFEHGIGSLVKMLKFGNADALVVGSHYRSWYA